MAVAGDLIASPKDQRNQSGRRSSFGVSFRRRVYPSESPTPGWVRRVGRSSFLSLPFACTPRYEKSCSYRLGVVISLLVLLWGSSRTFFRHSPDPELSDADFEAFVSTLEPQVLDVLRRPPRITPVFRHAGNTSHYVPKDHAKPYVYAALGIPAMDADTNRSQILLSLYSQGTMSWAEPGVGVFNLNVTSCLVGEDRFPVVFNASGVYTCPIDREILFGERLSVLVSPSVSENWPLPNEKRNIKRYLAESEQLGDGSFVVDSNVLWNGQMEKPLADDEGRYKVCMMTQEKTFPEYIPEWVSYHRRLGVDHVYIYDNNAARNLSGIFKDAPDIEVIEWPWERSQLQAQNHFLLSGRFRCQWAVLIDVDEYVMLRPKFPIVGEPPLKKYLRLMREVRDYSQVRLTSVALGSSGHIYRPGAPLAETYWHYANIQDNLTKPIVWLGHALPDSLVHRVSMANTYYSLTTESALVEPETSHVALMHMKYRSWEDYVLKGRGGRNSYLVDEWSYSSNWTIHNPSRNHMMIRNAGAFTAFRKLWKRIMLYDPQPPVLAPRNDIEERYTRVSRSGYAWKKRRGLQNSTFCNALIEYEKCFRALKDWEIRKRDRLAQMGIEVEL